MLTPFQNLFNYNKNRFHNQEKEKRTEMLRFFYFYRLTKD